jgi:hypothetical protein
MLKTFRTSEEVEAMAWTCAAQQKELRRVDQFVF